MNIKNAKIYVENFRRRFVEQQEELSNLQSEIKAVAETIISAKQNGEEEFSDKEILAAVFAALDEWSTINDEDLNHVRNLFYQLAKSGDIDNLVVDGDEEDTDSETETDSENIISEYLNKSDKAKLKRAINRVVNEKVKRKLREQDEEQPTSRGSEKIPQNMKTDIIAHVDAIVSQYQDEEDINVLWSKIAEWMEQYLISHNISRSPLVELIDNRLTEIGINEEDEEEYAEESFSNFGKILKEEYRKISQRMLD